MGKEERVRGSKPERERDREHKCENMLNIDEFACTQL